MTTIGSPATISILLHCHCDPRPLSALFPQVEAFFPFDIDAIRDLSVMGAIETTGGDSNRFRTTALGRAWVKALCDTPPPAPAFVDQAGRVITDY